MKLYEEILLLQYYTKRMKFVVENVVGFYKPLISPQEIAKHYFWTNFYINPIPKKNREHMASIETLQIRKGFDLTDKKIAKRTVLRNCVEPELGLHIFQSAFRGNNTLF